MFIEVSSNLKKLSKFFPENLYVVGGYVRDKLLGFEDCDVDLASSVSIDEVARRLENSDFSTKIKSLKFGSIIISKDEESFQYTAFRKDTYKEGGTHQPLKIERTDNIVEDANRRDFTINSIFYNINKDEIFDIKHGIIDLNQKIIRCNINPDDVLRFDGERILRMVRLAGELDFGIDKTTLRSGIKFASNVESLQGSRKFAEIEKILYCDQRHDKGKKSLVRALKLLNTLKIWKFFGVKKESLHYKMVYRTKERFLGLLIDIVDREKPECLEVFLDKLLREQFGFSSNASKKVFVLLSGYYNALSGMSNKEYFFQYFENWQEISPLLQSKSKHVQSRYQFFYSYIIEHGLAIRISDLDLTEDEIQSNFKRIDKRNFEKILRNLLSKVFDGKLVNKKDCLLAEIERNLQNY